MVMLPEDICIGDWDEAIRGTPGISGVSVGEDIDGGNGSFNASRIIAIS